MVVVLGMSITTRVFSQTTATVPLLKTDQIFAKKKPLSFFKRILHSLGSTDSVTVEHKNYVMQTLFPPHFNADKFSRELRKQMYQDNIAFGLNYGGGYPIE